MINITWSELKQVISRYFVLLLVIPLVITGMVYIIEKKMIPPSYTASTQLLLVAKDSEGGQSFDELRTSVQLIGTFSTIIQSNTTKQSVATKLGRTNLTEDIQVETDQNSLIFTVYVTGNSSKKTIEVANTLGQVVTDTFPKLFGSITVHIVEVPVAATIKPITFQVTLAAIFGGMISILLVFILAFFNSIITSDAQVKNLGLDVIGTVPLMKK
ncbi:YveK family protein [Carnobacterium maltaromaticum]|uniref:YveK family protein n=1 Tax=Carnobacterium maltaromaticum TaxID=2751 RepID=UPI00191BB3D2|nr:Wzz/FepE/Etk N-terminal domain-containing protein [Carnobacterium maltaromaticum]CAD5902907.1 conserved hypothetical protein [Carnobacterium maltaromaticum]